MSYSDYLRSEAALAPHLELNEDDFKILDNVFDIIDKQGHSGGSMSILNSYLAKYMTPEPTEEDANAIFYAKDMTDGLVKDAFAAFDGLTMIHAMNLAAIASRVLAYRPLSPITGDESEWSTDYGSKQNRRFSTLFRDIETGKVYWLDRDGVYYPRPWGVCNRWTGQTRRGEVSLPVDENIKTVPHYYTDESLTQRLVVEDDTKRAILTNHLLASARGINIQPTLNPMLEIMDSDVANDAIDIVIELIKAQYAVLEELRFPGELHHTLLTSLSRLEDYEIGKETPDTERELFGQTFPITTIPHLLHAISLLPLDFVIEGDLVTSPANGSFQLVPVYLPNEEYTKWMETGAFAVRWVDDLNQIKQAAIWLVSSHLCQEVAGDTEDWLWQYRDHNQLPHPERYTAPGMATTCSADVVGVNEAMPVESQDHTDPAEPLES